MTVKSPAEVILERSQAFARGDFDLIFDSYHTESNFRRQFPDRETYVRFGQAILAQDYQIASCRILAEEIVANEARVLLLMKLRVQESLQYYAELAWLRFEADGWRYHRSQKMAAEELPEDPASLCFADFAKLDPRLVF